MTDNNDTNNLLYRCGWCGQPTDKIGNALQDVDEEYLPLWNGAISVNGKCCEATIRSQELYMREMMELLYND